MTRPYKPLPPMCKHCGLMENLHQGYYEQGHIFKARGTQREQDLERALKLAVNELHELAPYLEGKVFGTWEANTARVAAILEGETWATIDKQWLAS